MKTEYECSTVRSGKVMLMLAFALAFTMTFSAHQVAAAPTFTVNSVNDAPADPADTDYTVCRTNVANTTCTLRAAIMKANQGGNVTINVPSGTYTLTIPPSGADDDSTGDLNTDSRMTIVGAGAASTIIDGNATDRVLMTGNNAVTISGVTIRNGKVGNSNGGGIYNYSGPLTLNNVIVSGNTAGVSSGGGIWNDFTAIMTLNNVTVTGNTANSGGGIQTSSLGTMTLNNCTVSANTAVKYYGGGIANIGSSTMVLNNCAINANSAVSDGGGIVNSGTLTLNNSTISANSAHGNGGGIYHIGSSGTTRLFHVTVAGNIADRDFSGAGVGGGIYRAAGANTNELWNTLLVENYAANQANDCAGDPMTSQDYNYIQTTFGCTIGGTTTHNISGFDALLDALQNNGGATQTRALFVGSPAIDQIPPSLARDSFGTAPIPDQRGVARPVGPLADIGAYEGAIPLSFYDRNLIRNSDAENGAGSATGGFVGVPNWTVTEGQFTVVPYNSAGGFPNVATDLVPANHGYNFFAGGNAALSQAAQIIDVSSIGGTIDAGKMKYALSADLGGYSNQDDNATLSITFLDGTVSQIGSPVTIGPVTAADRGNATGFRNKSANGVVPATTRTIQVLVTMTAGSGGYNDGYADNLSFVLTPPPALGNISTRLRVESGDNVLIGGFIVTGTQPKKVIVRGIGPSLPLSGVLADPLLELHDGSGTLLESNDNWQDSPNKQAIIDSTIPPTNNLESAIVRTLPANSAGYTAILRGVNNGTGIGVVEAYDLDRTVDSKLANISTRGLVQTGDNVLIAGTIVVGQASQKVIIRAIGPSLSVPGKLADPTLELHDGNGSLLESNDNWVDSPNKQAIIDSTIPPTNNLESAIVRTLAPGNYTAIVRGVNNTTGIAVVEVYALN